MSDVVPDSGVLPGQLEDEDGSPTSSPTGSSPRRALERSLTKHVELARSFNRNYITRSTALRLADPAWVYVLRGMAKGFLIYVLPISVFARKISGIRRGIALSVFIGIVRAFSRLLAWMNVPQGKWVKSKLGGALTSRGIKLPVHGISGAIAAFISIRFIDPTFLNSTFVFWCLVRSFRTLPLPHIPHADTIIMCLSAAQILSTWIVSPQDLPKGYLRFLNHHGQKDSPACNSNTILRQDFCGVVHPGQSHIGHFIVFITQGFLQAWKVYAPLYAVLFVFARKKNFKHLILNILQSSLFLCMYCGTAYLSGCIFYNTIWKISWFRNLFGGIGRASFNTHLWTSGLALLFERESRRPELSAYCLTFALESLYRYFIQKGTVSYSPALLTLLICTAAGIILQNHAKQPQVVMNWLFGLCPDPHQNQTITK
eukprot:TRINITY_DN12156_c0_g1_i1.p1 TRINITY_DN12156_c0_g1~~TRINITY_DN12156_c0_g1_i1.p1  ORF type:complete len:428 (-),score=52.24 TRINITY_DN12156_c0_g1_i1:31-1314(-)